MTMPHLMNCPHSKDGWCLACVAELHKDCERINFLSVMNNGWPVTEEISIPNSVASLDIYSCISNVMPDEWEPDNYPDPTNGVDANQMAEAFRMMVDSAIEWSSK